MKIDRVTVLGACMSFALLASCGQEEQLTVGKHSSHSHTHYHGQLQHSHANVGAHTHEWVKKKDNYRPNRPRAGAHSIKIPLDVSAIAARPGAFHGRPVLVQGIITSAIEKGARCRIKIAPLTGKGRAVLVEGKRGLCAARDSLGQIATVQGTFFVKRHDDDTPDRGMIAAENVRLKTPDSSAHDHNGQGHSHPHNGPHGHNSAGEIVTP